MKDREIGELRKLSARVFTRFLAWINDERPPDWGKSKRGAGAGVAQHHTSYGITDD